MSREDGNGGAVPLVRLREIERADVASIHRWRLDRRVSDTLVGTFRHVGIEADEQWFDRYCDARDREIRLAVELEETGSLVGVCYLLAIDWVTRVAQYGLMIGEPDQWGRGIGTEATRQALAHAFGDLNLHRVELTVLETHSAAIRAYEKAGFTREGVLREAAFKRGSYRSLVLMSCLSGEATS